MRTPIPVTTLRLSALVLAASLAACAGTPGPTADPTAEPPPVTAPGRDDEPTDEPADVPVGHDADPDAPAGPPLVASWDPGAAPLVMPDGSLLQDCDGDVPALCVVRGGVEAGLLLHSSFPAPDGLAAAGPDGLRAFAAARVEEVAADRSAGCGPDHVVVADPVAERVVAGLPGVRYGFTTRVGDTVVEHVAVWAVVRGDALDLVVAEATAAPGCMHGELTTFAPGDLVALLPDLDRVMAATPLPAA